MVHTLACSIKEYFLAKFSKLVKFSLFGHVIHVICVSIPPNTVEHIVAKLSLSISPGI